MREKPKSVVGSPPRGKDFWDREEEIREIWRALERDHVLLVAPRRFGKTGLMLHLMDHPEHGARVYYLDTEWIEGPADFIAEFTAELLKDKAIARLFEGAKNFFGGVLDRIKAVGVAEFFKVELKERIAKDWREKGREFILRLKGVDGHVVFLIDEFPLMLSRMLKKNPGEAEEFLHWFRGIRQMPDLSNVRFVVGGSIGVEHVLKKTGVGRAAINDLRPIRIEAFSEEKAREFIRALLRSEANLKRIPAGLPDKFMEILEVPVPFFIQILVSESIREAERQGKPLSAEIIEKAYSERVLASYNRTYFEHYYTRLKEYYSPEDANVAKAILRELARRREMSRDELWSLFQILSEGKGDEEKFSYLLSDLENDFYIQFDPASGSYRFATKVLRDWWLRHYAALR